MKKSLFLTFCFSFIPGASQMYQGYMKKGLSIMIMFATTIAILAITEIALFAIPIPIIFAYSFFNTYNLRNKIGTTTQEEDKYIWEEEEGKKIFASIKIKEKNTVLGSCLILVGIYILLNSILLRIANVYDVEIISNAIYIISRYLPSFIIAALSILFGLKFILNKNEK